MNSWIYVNKGKQEIWIIMIIKLYLYISLNKKRVVYIKVFYGKKKVYEIKYEPTYWFSTSLSKSKQRPGNIQQIKLNNIWMDG
jgi:hypothetical protein